MRFPTPMADMTTALYATIGVLAALQARERSGRGQMVDLSLLESQVSWLTNLVPAYFLTGQPQARIGNAHPMLVPYRLYQASDKAFNIGVGTDTLWQRFCQALDRPDLAADERFTSNADRVQNRDELEPLLDAHFAQREAGYWLECLREARIPCGQVNTLPEILADEHFRQRGGIVEMDHPLVRGLKVLANPLHFSETPPLYDRHPPLLGEQTEKILGSLGYNEEQIAAFRAAGAV